MTSLSPAVLAAIPKVELHCHLDMIADPAMLRDLAAQGHHLPLTADQLAAAYPVRSYDDFWRWSNLADALEGDLTRYGPLLAIHAARLKAQNVIYTEITIGSSELPRDHGALLDRMQAFRAFVGTLEEQRLQIEFLVAIARTRTPESAAELAERVLLLHRAGLVVGVAVCGPEAGHPVQPFRQTLARLHGEGVGIEVHAGEWAGPESVRDALDYGFPDRIGHGATAFADPALVEEMQARGIHIEFCPTSNLSTGAVARVEDVPLRAAAQHRLSFSINSDDPGPFACSVASEYQLAAEVFGLSADNLLAVSVNALNARLQPELRYLETISAQIQG